ncbi:MAG: hypothetical protein HN580_28735 [Deltaproteobacteria bacterium]|nr:hypothetical protein [Deltaproteobacteria bacterium]MBT4266156.1 hypothetical protein [Deltaproteobacteria bacterium]MBT4637377.1 hypothetical protein [Deltaproteobacteria bacterium]MBT6501408.1 hypothetical protein [Deltaproteobacteria bacterium]MBT6614130.1 hypothetical protein [Deltaproteobacteria bacterium]
MQKTRSGFVEDRIKYGGEIGKMGATKMVRRKANLVDNLPFGAINKAPSTDNSFYLRRCKPTLPER